MSSKLDESWEKLFDKYNILSEIESNNIFEISADDIKEFREPRLMTKFDWSKSRPELFRKNQLSILPNSRGTYVIGKFKAYESLNYQELKPINVSKPDWVRSFDKFSVTSESVALNLAQMTGMIDQVMGTNVGEPDAVDTITGRLKSGDFKYNIDLLGGMGDSFEFEVGNSQVEIDAGYENISNLAVIEAKNRIPEDFMIRQLYYPYVGYNNLNTRKKVLPIYFTHADDIYGFHIFEFKDINNYSSIKKVKQLNFIIDENLEIHLDDVKYISKNSPNNDEPNNIPFPQADNFTRILDILKYLGSPQNGENLAINYGFDKRQGDYYGNALVYLGLAFRNNHKFELTGIGKIISKMSNNNSRNKKIIELVLSHKIFNLVFENTLNSGGEFDNEYIKKTLLQYSPSVGSESTASRRTSTVKNWISWVLEQII
ncbi:hypothetical protein IV73_GL000150 [Weissella kandleri]|uniref:Uncharacterized protein n=1 Tax=Weissella kandleri TaxID=1616 RepID=A0A0R2JMK3_9LACO|nr:hypothetical protein [Weissella kandleri]KRN75658.1 hypothetical protein IV73_GL000150 [Weissella kandleri]